MAKAALEIYMASIKRLTTILLLMTSLLTTSYAQQICVLANRSLPINHLSRSQVADIYQGNPINGHTLFPVNLAEDSNIYRLFYQNILHWNPSQVNAYWSSQVFGGGGNQPQTANSVSEAIEWVKQHSQVIAFVPMDQAYGAGDLKKLYCFGQPSIRPSITHHRITQQHKTHADRKTSATDKHPSPVHQAKEKTHTDTKNSNKHVLNNVYTKAKNNPKDKQPTVSVQANNKLKAKQKDKNTDKHNDVKVSSDDNAKRKQSITQPKPKPQVVVASKAIHNSKPALPAPQAAAEKTKPTVATSVNNSATQSAPGNPLDAIAHHIQALHVADLINKKKNNTAATSVVAKASIESDAAADNVPLVLSDTMENQAGLLATTKATTQTEKKTTSTQASANNTALIWPDLISHFKLNDHAANPRVRKQIQWYLSHPAILNAGLKNAAPYLQYVLSQTTKRRKPGLRAFNNVGEMPAKWAAFTNSICEVIRTGEK